MTPTTPSVDKAFSPIINKQRYISPPYLEDDDDSLSREEIEGPVPIGFQSSPVPSVQKYSNLASGPDVTSSPINLKNLQREMLIEQNDLDNQMQIYNNVELEIQRLKDEEMHRQKNRQQYNRQINEKKKADQEIQQMRKLYDQKVYAV